MPVYYFDLHQRLDVFRDAEGTELADVTAAISHAHEVARELMKHREPQNRHCTLEIHDGTAILGELQFATVDPTLDRLEPRLREQIELLSKNVAACMKTIRRCRRTFWQMQAVTASSAGRPYLAAIEGDRIM